MIEETSAKRFNNKIHIVGVAGTDATVNAIVANIGPDFDVSHEILKYEEFSNEETKLKLYKSLRGKFNLLVSDRYNITKFSSPYTIKYNDRLMQELFVVRCAKNAWGKGLTVQFPSYEKKPERFSPTYKQEEPFQNIFGPSPATNIIEVNNIKTPINVLVDNILKPFKERDSMFSPHHEKIHLIATQDTAKVVESIQQYLVNTLWPDVVSSEISLYKESSLWVTEVNFQWPVEGKHVYVIADVNGKKKVEGISTIKYNDRLVQWLLLLERARAYWAETLNTILGCFPYSRLDKPTQSWLKERTEMEPAAVYFMASIMKNLGVKYCVTMDIHNPAMAYDNFVNLHTGWLVEKVIDILQKESIVDCPMDEWWLKKIRAISADLGIPHLTVIKARNHTENGVIDDLSVYGDVKDKDILVHDDILDTWWSLEKLIIKLHAMGARSINIAITHGMFNKDAISRLITIRHLFEKIYVTNTIYRDSDFYPDFVEVVDASDNFADVIDAIYKRRPITYNYWATKVASK